MIPQTTLKSLHNYLFNRVSPGSFLRGCLENRMTAIMQADTDNLANIRDIMLFIYNYLPSTCWGDTERVYEWLNGSQEIDPLVLEDANNAFVNKGLKT